MQIIANIISQLLHILYYKYYKLFLQSKFCLLRNTYKKAPTSKEVGAHALFKISLSFLIKH